MTYSQIKPGQKKPLVKTLKLLLSHVMTPDPPLPEGTTYDKTTQQLVIQFQVNRGLTKQDGTVDAETWKKLREELGDRMEQLQQIQRRFEASGGFLGNGGGNGLSLPGWFGNISDNRTTLGGNPQFNRRTFFTMYMEEFGVLDSSALSALDLLLDFFETETRVNDLRYFAYLLATIKVECADTYQPITERGGRSYFDKYEPTTAKGKELGNKDKGDGYKYRGRGYVQITGKANYEKLGKRIGLDQQLVTDPEKALEAVTAYDIMIVGTKEGLFTGKKLGSYIEPDQKPKYKAARYVINGQDRAEEIAGYAEKFEAMLNASRTLLPLSNTSIGWTF